MRPIYFSILFFFCIYVRCAAEESSAQLISQEIRYSANGAHEVCLVWGINNWQSVPKEFWPAGSYLKNKLLYTPLKKGNDYFSVRILVPKNTMLDYVFWISKGYRNAPADIWDVNTRPEKDYHTLALINSAILIESTIKATPKEMLSVFDLAISLFIVSSVLLLAYLFYKKRVKLVPQPAGAVNIILSSSITLFLFLLFVRPSITGTAWDIYCDPLNNLSSLLRPSLYDLVFVLICTVAYLFFVSALYKFPRLKKWATISFVFLCAAFLIIGLLNIRVVEALGKPFTYQWLYYSDFLKSSDAKIALASNMNADYLIRLALVSLSALMVGYLLVCLNKIIWRTRTAKITVLSTLATVSGVYLLCAISASPEKEWDINKLSNPVSAFLGSINPLSAAPELFTMEVADSLQYNTLPKRSLPSIASGKIKNVVLFVLESTPAEYISAYGSKYPVTPELSKYLDNALVFKNIYAHAPATNNSMVSLLGSIYPMISYATLTQKHPGMTIPTLSSELKNSNYKTAFFNSADNRFQRAGEFLAQRKFDVIKDCRDHANFKVHYEDAKYLSGRNDQNTLADMQAWIAQNRDNPFFAMMWTYQTHYPYFSSEQEINYDTRDPVFNRYLNAVHHSDKVFGELIEYLKKTGLYESTLVVLVGDHGEAFGRHGQTTHASHIYEENLHVPCVFLNPAFNNKEYAGLGGLIDVAPTIMSLLKHAAPLTWQGKDLFTANEKDRVYFFSSWSDYLFGYREGKHKYIFNASRNLTEVYDLEADPLEENNIANQFASKIEISHQRMAGWVQSVNRFMQQRIMRTP